MGDLDDGRQASSRVASGLGRQALDTGAESGGRIDNIFIKNLHQPNTMSPRHGPFCLPLGQSQLLLSNCQTSRSVPPAPQSGNLQSRMAKSARSSAKKANKRALKEKVFGPVEDARIERLSAKLQEVITKRKQEVQMTDAAEGANYLVLLRISHESWSNSS